MKNYDEQSMSLTHDIQLVLNDKFSGRRVKASDLEYSGLVGTLIEFMLWDTSENYARVNFDDHTNLELRKLSPDLIASFGYEDLTDEVLSKEPQIQLNGVNVGVANLTVLPE